MSEGHQPAYSRQHSNMPCAPNDAHNQSHPYPPQSPHYYATGSTRIQRPINYSVDTGQPTSTDGYPGARLDASEHAPEASSRTHASANFGPNARMHVPFDQGPYHHGGQPPDRRHPASHYTYPPHHPPRSDGSGQKQEDRPDLYQTPQLATSLHPSPHPSPAYPQQMPYQQHTVGGIPTQYPASPSRPFSCDQCALSFNRQHDLKRHRDTHTGDKPFLCRACGKTFTRKDALKRHQLVKQCGLEAEA